MITAILLATGAESTRMPRAPRPPDRANAALALADARSLRPSVDRLIVVVRPEVFAETVRGKERGIEILGCPHGHQGVAASLAYAIRVTGGAAGWVVATAGLPVNQTGVMHAIADQLRRGALLVMPRLRLHRHHHPLGFGRALGPELSALTRDTGLVAMLRRARRLVRRVPSEPPSPPAAIAAEPAIPHASGPCASRLRDRHRRRDTQQAAPSSGAVF
ncbi:MAG: nucleotidyltransferase family protein [Gammaproteobacteria bacterium]|nr:nucleotidyltransferase family protein [Gammaproteobacteria bacterium]